MIGADQHVYPISFRQDGLGTYLESAVVEDGQWKVRTKMQADLCSFCNQWMRNIDFNRISGENDESENDGFIQD